MRNCTSDSLYISATEFSSFIRQNCPDISPKINISDLFRQHSLPVCSDMVDVFFYLRFEIICRRKWSIVSDDVHDVDMDCFPIYIAIKPYDVDFKVSFFSLV